MAPGAQPAAPGAQPATPGVAAPLAGSALPPGQPAGSPAAGGLPGVGAAPVPGAQVAAASTPVAGGQPNISQSLNQPGAVNAGDLVGLFRAANTFRSQPGEVLGAKRFKDKPVLAGYSWMVQLLPHLGHQELYAKFQLDKDWTDKDNLPLTFNVIPAFIDPTNPQVRWTGFPFGNEGPALTHYVGMSGAEDARNIVAAALPRTDPAAGVFGYDQVARDADITDGTSNTVLMISAGRTAGPWAQGGGATIRGARAPYFDDLTGFGSGSSPGAGVMVIFADGSSRILSKQMDPAVFRALCTIHGAETVDLNRLDTPAGAGGNR